MLESETPMTFLANHGAWVSLAHPLGFDLVTLATENLVPEHRSQMCETIAPKTIAGFQTTTFDETPGRDLLLRLAAVPTKVLAIRPCAITHTTLPSELARAEDPPGVANASMMSFGTFLLGDFGEGT